MTRTRTEATTGRRAPGLGWLAAALGLTICGPILTRAAGPGPVVAGQSAGQMQSQRAATEPARTGTRLTFRITQDGGLTDSSDDQITIVFSDRAWSGQVPPYPLFGEDILQEFSFSAADLDNKRPLSFTRVVRDRTFLEARFIRVVNHGEKGWNAGTLTLLVDNRPFLDRVPLRPRKGDPTKGLQNWNRKQWRVRTYWEGELQQLRRQ